MEKFDLVVHVVWGCKVGLTDFTKNEPRRAQRMAEGQNGGVVSINTWMSIGCRVLRGLRGRSDHTGMIRLVRLLRIVRIARIARPKVETVTSRNIW